MLNFVKSFFCIYWDDHTIFIIQFVKVYHIDYFVDIEPSLCLQNCSYSILVYDSFNVLLNLISWYFVKGFSIYFHQFYWYLIFFFFWAVSGFGIRLMLVLCNEFENFLFSFILLK